MILYYLEHFVLYYYFSILYIYIIFLFQTLLVAGGYDSDYLSSTELLVGEASAWVLTGELPSPRYGVRGGGANIDNRVLMTGRTDNSRDLGDLSNIYLFLNFQLFHFYLIINI